MYVFDSETPYVTVEVPVCGGPLGIKLGASRGDCRLLWSPRETYIPNVLRSTYWVRPLFVLSWVVETSGELD